MENFDDLAQVRLIAIEQLEENIGQLAGVPENPRTIDEDRFALLKQDIIDYPEYLKYNPLKVYQLESGNYIILGGNMRFRALTEIGYKLVPAVVIDPNTPNEKLKAYAILDNNGFGVWDWGKLKSGDWDAKQLQTWGVELPDNWDTSAVDAENAQAQNESYSRKVIAPTYEPSGHTPSFGEMYDTTKRDALLHEIENANLPDEVREFLRQAAARHTVFNYAKIADYYAQASPKIQALMEQSALVIIDFDKAIENGFITMTKDLANAYRIERGITDEVALTENDISEDYDEE